jgi:hypothetical protein
MVLAAAIVFTLSRAGAATDLPQPARTFITDRCTECHDSDLKKGDLDLTTLGTQLDDPVLEARWALAYDRVQRGEMPPKKKAPLPPAERDAFLHSLGGFLADHDATRQAVAGRVVLRRLNRVEYESTVHDLLKIDTPLADLLPEDATADGFDNVSQALRLSAAQIDGYLEAADKALDSAIDLRPDPRINKRLSFLDIPEIRDALDMPFGSVKADGTRIERNFTSLSDAFILYINETFGPTTMRESHVPIAGRYRVRVSMFAHQSTGHPVVVARWMANNFITSRPLAELDLTPGQPRVAEFTAWMNQGEMLMLSASGLGIAAPEGSTVREVGADNFKGQGLGVNWVQIEGPLADTWPPPSVAQVFGDAKTEPVPAKKKNDKRAYEIVPVSLADDADRAIKGFAARAYRRPVSDDDVARYTALAHEALAHGATFENAVRRACKAILTSPQFLFLQEDKGKLDDYPLASRLSYFLWSTTPDEELLKMAAEGKLKDPAVLRAQTNRLLNSPRAHAFTKNFCGQWLNLRAIDDTTPDNRLYPEFDNLLKAAMVGETEAYFDEMLKSDLGVRNLIDSDFAMLNRRLAEHYEIPSVIGEEFRKVPLPPGSHRGGVLTQASILKVTANGTVTSPVVRGAWVVRRILGRQLQPPPANAGTIEPDTRGATTIREQLEKHRRMASCSVCHQYMDPPGFALENYDVIGGWRDWYRIQDKAGTGFEFVDRTTGKKVYVRKGLPVDPSGQLTDGRKFSDIDQLKTLLLDQQESIARNVANKLITYATGAGITFADRAAVQEVLDKSRSSDYGLRTLVQEVVQSQAFQTK